MVYPYSKEFNRRFENLSKSIDYYFSTGNPYNLFSYLFSVFSLLWTDSKVKLKSK